MDSALAGHVREIKEAITMKRVVVFLAAVMMSAVPALGVELLSNGNAEHGLDGWANPDDVWMTSDFYDRTVSAGGKFFFFPRGFKGEDGAHTQMYQDVSVKDYAGKMSTLSAYNRTWSDGHSDESILSVEFFGADGEVIDEGEVYGPRTAEWQKISITKIIPLKAVSARVSLWSVYHVGSESDSYFYDVSFTVDSAAALRHKESDAMMIVYLDKGSRLWLGAEVDGQVSYSSSAPDVARVNSRGKVTALKEGYAVITASGENASAEIQVVVEE